MNFALIQVSLCVSSFLLAFSAKGGKVSYRISIRYAEQFPNLLIRGFSLFSILFLI
jgi:hypothetical protein